MKKNEQMPAMTGLTAEDCERAFRRCRKCRFRGAGEVLCDYAGVTGRIRLKISPGVGSACTAFEEGEPPALKMGQMTPPPEGGEPGRRVLLRRQMRQLYDEGLSDRQIGEEVNRSSTAVRLWRIKEGLGCNNAAGRQAEQEAKALHREKKRLYDQGLLDAEIGEKVGRAKTTVKRWRLAMGLESNYTRKGSRHEENEHGGLGDPAELEQQKQRTGRTGENSG